jgi:hypothetical protein
MTRKEEKEEKKKKKRGKESVKEVYLLWKHGGALPLSRLLLA